MATKLLNKKVEGSHLDVEEFKRYLQKYVFTSSEEMNFLNSLCKKTSVYLFSGVIRDFFLSDQISVPRDIDLVLENIDEDIKSLLKKYQERTTQFGGYKLKISNTSYDIWPIKETWYFQNCLNVLGDWHKYKLPKTAFFNISAVVYSINDEKFYENGFHQILSNKNKYLGIVCESNPFPTLCIIRALDYQKRYGFRLKKDLMQYILNHYQKSRDQFIKVQLKHFDEIRYSEEEIDTFIMNIHNKILNLKKNRNQADTTSQLCFELSG